MLVVILAVCLIGGILIWFFGPGVRELGSFCHFDARQTGYAIDQNTGRVLGRTDITVRGTGCRFLEHWLGSAFWGTVDVSGFRNTEPEISGCRGSFRRDSDGTLGISYLQTYCVGAETGAGRDTTAVCKRKYFVSFPPEDRDLTLIQILNSEDNSNVWVISADSEEQALEKYYANIGKFYGNS